MQEYRIGKLGYDSSQFQPNYFIYLFRSSPCKGFETAQQMTRATSDEIGSIQLATKEVFLGIDMIQSLLKRKYTILNCFMTQLGVVRMFVVFRNWLYFIWAKMAFPKLNPYEFFKR